MLIRTLFLIAAVLGPFGCSSGTTSSGGMATHVRSNDCNAGLVCERGLCTAEQQLNFTNTDGSADGTSDGNTDGSNTGSADGSGDGSGNGNTDGSSNGNTDGSSNGSTNGSSDGSTDGSTDGGGSMGESAVCITDLFNIYGQGDCDDGFICLPDTPDSFLGRCRTSCGVPNADFVLEEDPSLCSVGFTCQTVLPHTYDQLTDTIIDGMYAMVCLNPTVDKALPCFGLYDPDSCVSDRECQIVGYDYVRDALGNIIDYQFTDYRCRDTCDPEGQDGTAGTCSDEEVCLWNQDPVIGYEVVWENDDPDTEEREWILCTKNACNDEDPNTPCTCGLDYDCISTTDGLSHCGRYEYDGWCGTPVDLLTVEAWEAVGGIDDAYICNEVDATQMCDDRPYRNPDVKAQLNCVGISTSTNEGVCMAFCEVPADPGASNVDPFFGSCPEDLECSNDLGVTMVFGPWVDSMGFSSRDDATVCDPVLCPEGLPCAACGDDAYCGTVPGALAGTTDSLCFMPYSFCQAPENTDEPVTLIDAGTDTDTGVTFEDAGSTDLDMIDAGAISGVSNIDAGEPTDPVVSHEDAGSGLSEPLAQDAGEGTLETPVADAGSDNMTSIEDAGL